MYFTSCQVTYTLYCNFSRNAVWFSKEIGKPLNVNLTIRRIYYECFNYTLNRHRQAYVDRMRQQCALLHSHGSETSECSDGARAQSTLYLHSTICIIYKLFNFELRFSSRSPVRFCIVHRYFQLASARFGLARSNSRRIHPLLIHRAGACAPSISIALEGEGESILNKTARLSSSRRASPRNVF